MPLLMCPPTPQQHPVLVPVGMFSPVAGGHALGVDFARHAPWRGLPWSPLDGSASATAATAADLAPAPAPLCHSGAPLAPTRARAPLRSPGHAPQPRTDFGAGGVRCRVDWTVDAWKVRSDDRQAVSPGFEISFGSSGGTTCLTLRV